MSQNISLYNFNGHEIRIYGTEDEPWFVAKDVAVVLDLESSYRNFVSTLDEDQKDTVDSIHTLGGPQKMTVIDESAVYEMIFKSRKPEAKKFRKWVCKEILPAIRRKGRFELKEQIEALKKQRFLTKCVGSILVKDRIISLGYIKKETYEKFMKTSRMIDADGEEYIFYSPKKYVISTNLGAISKLLTIKKKELDGDLPEIRQRDRRNAYYISDYERFGDDIIREYFEEKPFNTWVIVRNDDDDDEI